MGHNGYVKDRTGFSVIRPPYLATAGWLFLSLLLWSLTGCARSTPSGPVHAGEPDAPSPTTAGNAAVDYWRDVQPIFERRCAVCHGCYDAPCQLNLTAYEGIIRGAHKKPIYDITRLRTAEQTRLFEDAHSVAAWRKKHFSPVIQKRPHATEEARRAGVLARMLTLKRAHPLPSPPLIIRPWQSRS